MDGRPEMTDVKKILNRCPTSGKPTESYKKTNCPPSIEAARQYPYAGGKRMRLAWSSPRAGRWEGMAGRPFLPVVAIEYTHNSRDP